MTLLDQPPNAIRWEPQLPQDWCSAIGKIALFSAQVETELHCAYWYCLGVPDGVGKIVTGDMNPKRLGEDLIKMARERLGDTPRVADLKILVRECDSLLNLRNQCIHWTWGNVVNNKALPHRPLYKRSGTPQKFDIQSLNKLGDDLAWLATRLEIHSKSDADIEKERAVSGLAWRRMFLPAP